MGELYRRLRRWWFAFLIRRDLSRILTEAASRPMPSWDELFPPEDKEAK